MQLYNTLSAEERRELITKAGEDRLTLSFYQYAHLANPQELRDELFLKWEKLEVLGRTYIAKEGINAQISLPAKNIEAFREDLYTYKFLNGIRLNVAIEQDSFSFLKNKIKVRNKIVADGLNDESFDVTNKGIHLKAKEFNAIIEDSNTVLVDMRNHYESEIGHFKGAVTPDVDTFRDSLDIIENDLKEHKEEKNLVMYCTGGIRCEKASAYYKHKGFKNVFQLEGGIIEYTRQIKEEGLENKFLGKNFVFDERRAEKISEDVISKCHQCDIPCDTHVNCKNKGCHLLFIQCEACQKKMLTTCSDYCKKIVQLPEEEQKKLRSGTTISNKIFRKGRSQNIKKITR
ncbi:MAG: rhodanese-related sulfurtransferase [Flavobacteriales bacterium]